MGLRADKKLRVRTDIERMSLQLVLDRGYDNVTVEEICEAVGISKKTFFNYFPSKASAVAGYSAPFPSAGCILAELERRADENYVDVLVDLLASRVSLGSDAELAELRRRVLRAMPQLFYQGQREMPDIMLSLTDAVRALLREHPDRRAFQELDPEREAFVSTSVAFCVARIRSMLSVECGHRVEPAEARAITAAFLMGGIDGVACGYVENA